MTPISGNLSTSNSLRWDKCSAPQHSPNILYTCTKRNISDVPIVVHIYASQNAKTLLRISTASVCRSVVVVFISKWNIHRDDGIWLHITRCRTNTDHSTSIRFHIFHLFLTPVSSVQVFSTIWTKTGKSWLTYPSIDGLTNPPVTLTHSIKCYSRLSSVCRTKHKQTHADGSICDCVRGVCAMLPLHACECECDDERKRCCICSPHRCSCVLLLRSVVSCRSVCVCEMLSFECSTVTASLGRNSQYSMINEIKCRLLLATPTAAVGRFQHKWICFVLMLCVLFAVVCVFNSFFYVFF